MADAPELHEAFEVDEREATRATTAIGAVIALVAMPAWAIFDRLLVPREASRFLVARLIVEVVIAGAAAALLLSPRRFRPELLAFTIVVAIEGGIAWMLPRTGDHLEVYLLGLSLPVFASGFLIAWRWQWAAASLLALAGSVAVFGATAPRPLDAGDASAVGFYLGTAGAMAIAAQVQRGRTRWQRFVALADLEEERRRSAELVSELDRLSRHDPLTGIGNRRMWQERVTAELQRAKRSGEPLSVIVCDLDHFKMVNDTFGHAAGDVVLQKVADLLSGRFRATDVVARLGGDEFAVLCPNTPLIEAERIANDLVALTRASDILGGSVVTISMGVAQAGPVDAPEQLLSRADRALYAAKATRSAVGIG